MRLSRNSIGEALRKGANTLWNGITKAASAVGRFLYRNWYLIAAAILALAVFAALTTAMVFFWPAIVGAIAGLSLTLPLGLGVLSLHFLGTLALPAAAAVISAVAAGVTFVASLVAIVVISKANDFFQKKGTPASAKPGAEDGVQTGQRFEDDEDEEEDEEAEVQDAPGCFGRLCSGGSRKATISRRYDDREFGSSDSLLRTSVDLGTPIDLRKKDDEEAASPAMGSGSGR